MEKKLTRTISFILHPLLMPTIGMMILFSSGTYVSLLSPEAKKILLLVVATGTLFFPVGLMPFMFYRKLISDIFVSNRQERALPMVLTFLLYLFTFYLIYRLRVNRIIHGYLLAVNISLLLSIPFTTFMKISTHMVGLGAIAALILSLMILFGVPLQAYFILALLASGLAGYSALYGSTHSEKEVYLGFLLGFAVMLTVMLLYNR